MVRLIFLVLTMLCVVPLSVTGADNPNQGVVLSSLDASGYTYIEVETPAGRVWVAGTRIDLKRGERILWEQPAVMTNFYSKTLDRTFEKILFVSRVKRAEAPINQMVSEGKVLTVLEIPSYVYLEVRTPDDQVVWLAAPSASVAVDDTVNWRGGMTMRNFTSSTLDRTFPAILFVNAVQVGQK